MRDKVSGQRLLVPFKAEILDIALNERNYKGHLGVSLQYAYSYDELNRLKESYAYQGLNTAANTWSPSLLQDLKEELSYDANGNILTLRRNGNNTLSGSPLYMDNLKYSYYYIKTNGLRGTYRPSEQAKPADALFFTNQLSSVNDNQDYSANYANDIDNQSANNYAYDAIGNLIKDNQAGINTISWNVYGKIKSIDKAGTAEDISYTYDAAGNRVKKTVGTTQTYYIRDAQGNTLAVYEQSGSSTLWKEQQLYGSSRLGIWKPELNLASGTATLAWQQVGNKFFELSNHLGNVLGVISNKRHQSAGNTFEADVVSAQDYYAGGSLMPGRTYTAANSSYRYGFNGKENDNEVKGEGNQQDYGMRIYDNRLGRFLSVDPLYKSYPELTPYQFASNSPIENIDLDGLEKYSIHYTVRDGKDVILKIVTDNSLKYDSSPNIMGVPTWKPKVAEYIKYDNNGKVLSKSGELPLKNLGSTMYVGPWNPEKDKTGNEFYLPAINSLDAAGLKHDKEYARLNAAGPSSAIMDLGVIDADKALVKDAAAVVDMFIKGKKDPITKQKVSMESAATAYNVVKAFSVIVIEKSVRIGLNDAADAFKQESDNMIQKLDAGLKSVDNWIPMPAH